MVERVHGLITDFIYKMPEKIKDMRNKNDELFRHAEELYSAQSSAAAAAAAAAASASAAAASNASFYNSYHNYTQQLHYQQQQQHQQHQYHLQQQQQQQLQASQLSAAAAPLNVNRDFEDFLNLVGEIYVHDELKLELCLNYWLADSELNADSTGAYRKPSLKQVKLCCCFFKEEE